MKLLVSAMGVCVLMLVCTTCERRSRHLQTVAQQSPTSSPQIRPSVVVETNARAKLGRPLEINWSFYNAADAPIYIYSSLLKNAAFAEIAVDSNRKLIEIRFVRLSPLLIGVNAFPNAEFLKLEPKETRQGNFSSSLKVGTGELSKIGSGTYELQILIGYGNEIASVQQALAKSLADGVEHPINPIVRWQKVVYSKPVWVVFSR